MSAALGATIVAFILTGPAAAWQTAHGDPDNSSAADVRTARAVAPRATVSLGEIAPGAGPVIAPDGTVYVGNMDGTLMAFRPDGTPLWSRDIGGYESIVSSPVLGSDG
ncbi:MAG TPA: PQQ-binding-like beta-propeller repeat protein, partial [Dongiaceae bacterium]|nr:PQQ-binding-like beta-propeller repeat protein [Dongiaceae bacterium]